jgi:hypothetical protein
VVKIQSEYLMLKMRGRSKGLGANFHSQRQKRRKLTPPTTSMALMDGLYHPPTALA